MRNLKNLAATIAMLFCCIAANAQTTFEVDGLKYSIYSSTNRTVSVKKGSTEPTGDIVIPATVTYNDNEYRVTRIDESAFSDCSNLASIIVSGSVTDIGNYAFKGCSALKELIFSDGSGTLSLGRESFFGAPLETLYIGRDLRQNITTRAFAYTKSLANVTISDNVTSIEGSIFSGCSNLTSITIPENSQLTSIGSSAFYGCSSLTSITIPENVTSIGSSAFTGCRSLTSITIPENVTSILDYAFDRCTGIKVVVFKDGNKPLSLGHGTVYNSNGTQSQGPLFSSVPLETLYIGRDLNYSVSNPPFQNSSILSSVTVGMGVTSIGAKAFSGCSSLASIILSTSVTSIGASAFTGCSSLVSVTLPASVTSIGSSAFSSTNELILKSITPPTLTSSSLIPDCSLIIVPKAAYNDYRAATYWSSLLGNITIDDVDARVKNLTLKASDDKSSLLAALGEENVKFVTDLTISGSINSYDFMILRNQMSVLRHLNLKDASIVYNAHEHYTGHHTDDNQFPAYGLYNCKLFSLVFPKDITNVGIFGVSSNKSLSEVTLPKGLISIGNNAFSGCVKLSSIAIPQGVETVGNSAFDGCSSLTSITFLNGLKSIENYAFAGCTKLENVMLPPTVKTINKYVFQRCSKLKEIRIPSSVRTVGDYAFAGCTSLNDVYVYTVEPFNIGQDTFAKDGNQFIGTLHAPKVSYWNYYYNTQWNQFANRAEFDEPYENFYLVGDKELDSTTGAIVGEGDKNPDAEMGNNSGLIVEDDIVQDLGNVDIEHNGTDGGSIVVSGPDGCVNTGELHFHINVKAGKWYFFCFPFDVKREDIQMRGGADWVFRYYDGKERANNGKGGWKNVTSDGNGNFLKAATGYIFQCSREDVLVLTAKNHKIKHEDKYNELVAHATENMHDASWNFVGNPYLSYYEVTSEDYSAPITVWDGSKYIAIRPGDDDYQLAPFEGFFVQKPEDTYAVTYSADRQMTYNQAQESAAKARARRRAMPINPDRLLVNITLSNGEETDQTRVVFNNNAAMGYETVCDAAKFETAGMPQLYTVDSRAVKYAINERPVAEGIVTLGYTAPAEGVYTLAAPRMDTPISIKDNLTGTIHDFAEGSYEFASEAGTFDDRFTVIMKAGETGIENSEFNNQNSELYNVKGQRVNEATEQGIYIKDNRKVVIK